ncbi:MAG TPA: hypothetical protein VEV41_27140 [Terriglobales bacterium]|nr:hypothetical protein [Terriglobales bacterium]
MDEYLNNALCRYFFGARANYIKLWKTQNFRNFNYYVVEGLSLMEKLRFVKSIRKLPITVAADVERLNTLRNGIAHAFFPENLRSAKPKWKGKHIFTLDRIEAFIHVMDKLHSFFRKMKSTKTMTVRDFINQVLIAEYNKKLLQSDFHYISFALIAFDSQFHFYDLDFCRVCRQKELSLGTWPIAVTHASGGSFGSPQWLEARVLYEKKWQ